MSLKHQRTFQTHLVEGSRPVRHARTYHRQPEGQEQHQETKSKDQPHREEELRKREGRFRQNRFFPKV